MQNAQVRCQEAVGNNPVATLLLMRVLYWAPKAKVQYRNHTWIAKTRSEWQHEAGLSEWQVRSALTVLKQKKLIVLEQHMFGKEHRAMSFIRLTDRGSGLLNLQPGMEESIQPSDGGNPPTPYTIDTTIGTTGSNQEITTIAYGDANADSGEDSPGGNMAISAKDVLKNYKANTVPTTKLDIVWKTTIAQEYHDQVYIGEFTLKDRAQFARLKKIIPNQSDKVIETIIRRWPEFIEYVKVAKGLKLVPGKPALGFVVKYVHDAITFWNNLQLEQQLAIDVKAAAKSVPQPVQNSQKAAVQLIAHTGHVGASKTEVFSIFDEDAEE